MAVAHEHKPTFFEQAETFAKKYRNILIGLLVVVIGGTGYMFYQQYSLRKKQIEAAPKISSAMLWQASGIDSLALKGDGVSPGLLQIIDQYGRTKTGNLANYLAGLSYLRTGDYPNAIKHLNAFKAKSKYLGAHSKVLLGHAYAQAGDSVNAASAYLDATEMVDNSMLTPIYLKVAGDYHLFLGDYEKAEELFTRILNEYPSSSEGRDIERLIAFAKQKQI